MLFDFTRLIVPYINPVNAGFFVHSEAKDNVRNGAYLKYVGVEH